MGGFLEGEGESGKGKAERGEMETRRAQRTVRRRGWLLLRGIAGDRLGMWGFATCLGLLQKWLGAGCGCKGFGGAFL